MAQNQGDALERRGVQAVSLKIENRRTDVCHSPIFTS
jgi:hypothetical protein